MAYDSRRRDLEDFLRVKRSGQYHRDMAVWADEQGLCTRTAKQYWQRAVWKGFIEINGDHWKWVADKVVPKAEPETAQISRTSEGDTGSKPDRRNSFIVKTREVGGATVTTGTYVDQAELRAKLRKEVCGIEGG